MLTKDKLQKTIDGLPDKFTLDEVIEEIVLLDKIEKGLDDIKNGNTLTTDELKKRLNV